MMEFRRELKKLAEKILKIMEENLGIGQGHIKKAFTCDGECKPFFGTKVSHYPPCSHPDLVPGLRAHTDAGGVILLFQDEKVDGLQVLKDDRWFDVQPLANAIVINTGDQIEAVSNGKYKSAWHRILAKHDGIRHSIASFYNPCFRAVIGPAPTSENEGISYPKYVFRDYMNVYQKDKFGAKELRFMKVVKAE